MNELTVWQQNNAPLVERGIDESMWNAITQTIFPGAKSESCLMAWDYCAARNLDILMKPVHLVPMLVTDAQTKQKQWRDVVMPAVGLYRIQADRSGSYAGADAPKFGPDVTLKLGANEYTVPEWCEYTVYKIIGETRVAFSALEYWEENYASTSNGDPNAMWKKRKRGQIAKCAEAQALRKAWPEVGQEATAEEMAGKAFDVNDAPNSDIAQSTSESIIIEQQGVASAQFTKWLGAITSGAKSKSDVTDYVKSKGLELTQNQLNQLEAAESKE